MAVKALVVNNISIDYYLLTAVFFRDNIPILYVNRLRNGLT